MTIDARGGFLNAWLIESHAHRVVRDSRSLDLTPCRSRKHLLATIRNAKTMLDCGYTSAFLAAAAKQRLDVVLKREIDAGVCQVHVCWRTARLTVPAVSATTT